jgi:outer membrane biosynthesis protein TonB
MDGEQIVHDVAEKLRALINEAEAKAAEIVSQAEADAKRIREQAEAESQERLAAARNAFEELQSKLGIGGEVPGGPVPVPDPSPPPVPEPTPPPPDPAPSPEPAPEPTPPSIPEPTPPPDEGTPPQIAAEPAATNGAGKSADAAGARLVAMNMALDGAGRDEIVTRLDADYTLDDAGGIADEILAVAGK